MRRAPGRPPPYLRIPCQPRAAAALLLLAASCGHVEPAGLDPAACALWRDFATREADPVQALRAEAHRSAERLRTGMEPSAWEAERARIQLLGQAPGCSPDAAGLPWGTWVDEDERLYAELAAATLRAAHAALGAGALPLARAKDGRTTPDSLRLEAHRILWAEDPDEAQVRGFRLLLREDPRDRDTIRPAYVESVLAAAPPAASLDLLLQAAAAEQMEPRARLLAMRLLADRGEAQAVPVLEGVFLSQLGNFLVRREAMMDLLRLDPRRGRALLARRLAEEGVDPVLAEFLAALRAEHGVTPE